MKLTESSTTGNKTVDAFEDFLRDQPEVWKVFNDGEHGDGDYIQVYFYSKEDGERLIKRIGDGQI